MKFPTIFHPRVQSILAEEAASVHLSVEELLAPSKEPARSDARRRAAIRMRDELSYNAAQIGRVLRRNPNSIRSLLRYSEQAKGAGA